MTKHGAHFRSYSQFQKPQQYQLKTITKEPTKPNEDNKPEREQEQTKFVKPDEQINNPWLNLKTCHKTLTIDAFTQTNCNGSPHSQLM